MEKIGNQKIWSFFDHAARSRPAANPTIRRGAGHRVQTYFELAKKVAELQFLNRDHVLLFRGQHKDHLSTKGNSTLKAKVFRPSGSKVPTPRVLENRFAKLRQAEASEALRKGTVSWLRPIEAASSLAMGDTAALRGVRDSALGRHAFAACCRIICFQKQYDEEGIPFCFWRTEFERGHHRKLRGKLAGRSPFQRVPPRSRPPAPSGGLPFGGISRDREFRAERKILLL
jgi:hypothetical protein